MQIPISKKSRRSIHEYAEIAGSLFALFVLSAFLFGHVFSVLQTVPQATTASGLNPEELLNNVTLVYYTDKTKEEPKNTQGTGYPIRLTIPKIAVDAAIENVGLTQDGIMDISKNQDDAAWFELGSVPGQIGSAVIAGHYGWKNNRGSAFDNLHKLRAGDKIFIEDDTGASFSFVVTGARRYEPLQDASDVFGSNDGKAHLNLVTCEGEWDVKTQQYSKRLVVFADRE